ncbi:MAG: hypothetical protein ACM3KE_12595 [Hyphomicrobiales bacterium]
MNSRTTSPSRRRALRIIAILAGCLIQFALSCGDGGDQTDGTAPRPTDEGFTFFGLGRNSLYSERVRDELAERLGNDAIEHRSIIDLAVNAKRLLPDHLPELDAVNRQLNYPPGERVDHDVIRLMYRYARTKNAPFDFVDLIFDGQSRRPLVFRMHFKVDEAGMVESLRTKYGQPDRFAEEAENSRWLVWRRERDALVVSFIPDQFGEPTHHITLYFTGNLERLIASEQAARERKAKEKARSGKSAF